MAEKFINGSGLQYVIGKIKNDFVAKESGKGLSEANFTADEKAKLAGIAEGAQVNVIESVKVNGQALAVNGKAVDVSVPTKVGDLTNDAGYLVAADIAGKVDNTTTVNGKALSGNIELNYEDVGAVPTTRTVNGKALSSDITLGYGDVGAAAEGHVHDVATQSANGFMAAADKAKLDGIAEGANKTIVDAALSGTSSNPVENKAVKAALDGKADEGHTHEYAGSATVGGAANSAVKLETARKITVGNKEQSFDGTADITFAIADIGAIPATAKGVANGVATLGADGKIPSAQLPSYVDDVVEGYYSNGKFFEEASHATEIVAMSDKIYIDLATNKTYRYGGTTFVEITSGDMVALTNAELDEIYANA